MQTSENLGEKPSKINRENISRHLVEYQLKMVGKTIMDTLDDDMWYFNITMTQKQHEEFKAYALALIKKVFKCNKLRALRTFDWFNLEFGLRIKE
jgi:hypothetical protein